MGRRERLKMELWWPAQSNGTFWSVIFTSEVGPPNCLFFSHKLYPSTGVASDESLVFRPDVAEMMFWVIWKSAKDTMGFPVASSIDAVYTRSSLLSKVAGLFDTLEATSSITVNLNLKIKFKSIHLE